MQLISTDRYSKINSNKHKEWLNSLKDNDKVIIQSFHPHEYKILTLPYELWRFELGLYQGNKIYNLNQNQYVPCNPYEGWLTYWNSDNWWGEVFPARIVPISPYLKIVSEEKSVWADSPIFEPFYSGTERVNFLISHGKDIYKNRHRLTSLFPFSYARDVNAGILITAFSQLYPEDWNYWVKENDLDVKFLYSEDIKN